MKIDEQYAALDALHRKHDAEWLATRIAGTIEDSGSTDGTVAGIADSESRADCENQIAHTKRDHARNVRKHQDRLRFTGRESRPEPIKPPFKASDARSMIDFLRGDPYAVMDWRLIAESKAAKARLSARFKAGERLGQMNHRGNLKHLGGKLARANESGMAVCYSLNRSNGCGVQRHNIPAVEFLPLDLDKNPLPDPWPGDMTPDVIIESSPGRYQALFKIDPTDAFANASRVIKRLARQFGGDPCVSDRTRVLRMPGFRHQKGEPFTSRIIRLDENPPCRDLAYFDKRLPQMPRGTSRANDKGVGQIGPAEAKLLFDNLDVACLNGNETWQQFAMALHMASNACEEVAELFFDFCATDDAYCDEDTIERNKLRWESFSVDHEGGVGIGTLRHMLKEFRVPGLILFQLFNTAKGDFPND